MIKEKSARANEESYAEDFTTKYEYAYDGKVDANGNLKTSVVKVMVFLRKQ